MIAADSGALHSPVPSPWRRAARPVAARPVGPAGDRRDRGGQLPDQSVESGSGPASTSSHAVPGCRQARSVEQAGKERTQAKHVLGPSGRPLLPRPREPGTTRRAPGIAASSSACRTSTPVKSSLGQPDSSSRTWLGPIPPWTSPSAMRLVTAPASEETRRRASASGTTPRSRITWASVSSLCRCANDVGRVVVQARSRILIAAGWLRRRRCEAGGPARPSDRDCPELPRAPEPRAARLTSSDRAR